MKTLTLKLVGTSLFFLIFAFSAKADSFEDLLIDLQQDSEATSAYYQAMGDHFADHLDQLQKRGGNVGKDLDLRKYGFLSIFMQMREAFAGWSRYNSLTYLLIHRNALIWKTYARLYDEYLHAYQTLPSLESKRWYQGQVAYLFGVHLQLASFVALKDLDPKLSVYLGGLRKFTDEIEKAKKTDRFRGFLKLIFQRGTAPDGLSKMIDDLTTDRFRTLFAEVLQDPFISEIWTEFNKLSMAHLRWESFLNNENLFDELMGPNEQNYFRKGNFLLGTLNILETHTSHLTRQMNLNGPTHGSHAAALKSDLRRLQFMKKQDLEPMIQEALSPALVALKQITAAAEVGGRLKLNHKSPKQRTLPKQEKLQIPPQEPQRTSEAPSQPSVELPELTLVETQKPIETQLESKLIEEEPSIDSVIENEKRLTAEKLARAKQKMPEAEPMPPTALQWKLTNKAWAIYASTGMVKKKEKIAPPGEDEFVDFLRVLKTEHTLNGTGNGSQKSFSLPHLNNGRFEGKYQRYVMDFPHKGAFPKKTLRVFLQRYLIKSGLTEDHFE